MTIKYPAKQNVDEWMECALSHPTYQEGLNWLMIAEHERALNSFLTTASRDTCFQYLINRFTTAWKKADKAI